MAEERVNHPDYYNTGIECIELLVELCNGYEGIAAFDIGQCKYAYRAGKKKEEGLSMTKKAYEDMNKNLFYLNDFYIRARESAIRNWNKKDTDIVPALMLPCDFCCSARKEPVVGKLIAQEFAKGKPKPLAPLYTDLIEKIYNLKTFGDVREAINIAERIRDYLANDLIDLEMQERLLKNSKDQESQ